MKPYIALRESIRVFVKWTLLAWGILLFGGVACGLAAELYRSRMLAEEDFLTFLLFTVSGGITAGLLALAGRAVRGSPPDRGAK